MCFVSPLCTLLRRRKIHPQEDHPHNARVNVPFSKLPSFPLGRRWIMKLGPCNCGKSKYIEQKTGGKAQNPKPKTNPFVSIFPSNGLFLNQAHHPTPNLHQSYSKPICPASPCVCHGLYAVGDGWMGPPVPRAPSPPQDPVHPIWVICSESHYSVLFSKSPGDCRGPGRAG